MDYANSNFMKIQVNNRKYHWQAAFTGLTITTSESSIRSLSFPGPAAFDITTLKLNVTEVKFSPIHWQPEMCTIKVNSFW